MYAGDLLAACKSQEQQAAKEEQGRAETQGWPLTIPLEGTFFHLSPLWTGSNRHRQQTPLVGVRSAKAQLLERWTVRKGTELLEWWIVHEGTQLEHCQLG
eukprot:1144583-Pelagomonas_calceolata.AAC.7